MARHGTGQGLPLHTGPEGVLGRSEESGLMDDRRDREPERLPSHVLESLR